MNLLTSAVVGAGVGLLTVLLAVPILRRLPSPRDADGGGVRFAALVRPRFLIGLGLVASAVAALTLLTLPPSLWPPWLVLAVGGSLLAGIDGATTWLPNRVMYPTWLAMALALAVTAVAADPATAGRLLGCAVAWGVLFYVVWLLARGRLGFGDVRLAVLLGAGSGARGWAASYTSLLVATVLGALWGVGLVVVRRLARSGGSAVPTEPAATGFAYGLPLFLGCAAGLAVDTLLPGP